MLRVPDQIPVWDQKHSNQEHDVLKGVPGPFAEVFEPYLPRGAKILELGCGVGRDANFFTAKGHTVIATDGSEIAIRQNEKDISLAEVSSFSVLDMREPFPYETSQFDAVYGNLCLHYYDDVTTRSIIKEVIRVTKGDGLVGFSCKSYDSLHNAGDEIEPGLYASPNGQVIRLFTKAYMGDIMNSVCETQFLDEIEEDFQGRHAKIIQYIGALQPRVG